jgi:hypothetical protein
VDSTVIDWKKIEITPDKEVKVIGRLLLDFRAEINKQIIEINNLRVENERLQAENRNLKASLQQPSSEKGANIKENEE